MSSENGSWADAAQPNPSRPDPSRPGRDDRFRVVVIAGVAVAAAVAAVLLVIVLVSGGNQQGVAQTTASPTAGSSESIGAEASASASPSVAPSASPEITPLPTATPVPQLALEEGWARIDVALKLRSEADSQSSLVALLSPKQVIRITTGPEHADGYDWYRAATVTRDLGWIASGSAAHPFVTLMSKEATFLSCGEVQVTGGIRVNGLRPGNLDDAMKGVFEVASATGTDACVTYTVRNSLPVRYLKILLDSCGEPSWDGHVLSLKPSNAGDVVKGYHIKRTVVIRDAFLTEGSTPGPDGLTNKLKVMLLGLRLDAPFACVGAHVTETASNIQREFKTQVADCLVVTERDGTHISLAPASGGESVWLRKPNSAFLDPIPNGERAAVNLIATSRRGYELLNLVDLGSCDGAY